jgi:plant G-box-binding factor
MMAVAPAGVAGQLVGPAVSSAMTTALELRNSSSVHTKTNPTSAAQPSVVLPLEAWLQVR